MTVLMKGGGDEQDSECNKSSLLGRNF